MPTVVAFLRAINVGGRFLTMADLAAHVRSLGLARVSTYINSGNVLFETRAARLDRLESRMERELEPLLGFRSEVFLRTAEDLHAVAATAQAHRARLAGDGEVQVAFVREPLGADQLAALASLRTDRDDFAHTGREIYWLCTGDLASSTFSSAVLERKLRLRATFRRAGMLAKLSAHLRAAGGTRSAGRADPPRQAT